MSGKLMLFIAVSVLLPVLMGYSVLRGRKTKKPLMDFLDNLTLFVIWIVSIREVYKTAKGINGILPFDKYLFVGFVVLLFIPLTVYAVVIAKKELPRFFDVKAYSYPFLYRFRHVLVLVPWIMLAGTWYTVYKTYLLLFG